MLFSLVRPYIENQGMANCYTRISVLIVIFSLIAATDLYPQTELCTFRGLITDSISSQPVELVNVFSESDAIGTTTDESGRFNLRIACADSVVLRISHINYGTRSVAVPFSGLHFVEIIIAPTEDMITAIEVRADRIMGDGMLREGVRDAIMLPNATMSIEYLLPALAIGVRGSNELSSQYSVRGGNYDENLVYVNDFEIYRPLLIRSGQQEGLSFPNMDLIRELSFSSGGFQARYGDKMSSVLDIHYKRPDTARSSVSFSLLGSSAHTEGKINTSGNRALRYLIGARYKTTQYLLSSLETRGEYSPNFYDIQANLLYDLSETWQMEWIGNYSRSVYRFIPVERTTAKGLIDFALVFRTVFQGSELDDFTTSMTGVSFTNLPRSNNMYLKWMAYAYQSRENERFDIIGDYLLGELVIDFGSEDFGEMGGVIGAGSMHHFARNYLTSTVAVAEHRGGYTFNNVTTSTGEYGNYLRWGLSTRHERISDRLNEWERLDSAGYSLPFSESQVNVLYAIKSNIELSSMRYNAFLQNTWSYRQPGIREMAVTAGVRAGLWDYTGEAIFSPRLLILYRPLAISEDITWTLSGGLYYQPPFYRELRGLDGSINKNVVSQKSAHVVAGYSRDFKVGADDTPFRFIAEAYYKHLWDLVPFDLENVRIRYYGDNIASGYAMGIDFRLNGELVPNAESWINLSLMRTRERFHNIQHLKRELGVDEAIEVKDVPRPTDQLVTLNVFFQDYLPNNENFKTHLNFAVGTGLPFGIPENNIEYRNTYRYRPYHRIDIGFSFLLFDEKKRMSNPRHFLRFSESAWVSLEVFNLMQVANSASNTWIRTVYNTQYAISNYLTSRRINLKFRLEF